ncbi:hypothetical protein ES703_31920 [subsurface metagenome]
MESITRTFELERETKRTYRYREVAEVAKPEAVGTLYVQKWATGSPPPQRLTVTIEPVVPDHQR